MGDQALERKRAAREEAERGSDVARRVVERAGEAHFLVVDAVRVDGDARLAREAAEREHRASRPHERERPLPRLDRPGRLDRNVHARGIARDRAERRGERAALLTRPDRDRPRAGVRHARAEHQPDRAEADDGDGLPVLHTGHSDAVETAGKGLGQRRDLGRHARRHGEKVP